MSALRDDSTGDLPLAEAFNLRDLGGRPARDGRRVRAGRVYRGAGLQRLAGEDLAQVRRLSWTTVVDLRTDGEVAGSGLCPPQAARRPAVHRPMLRRTWDPGLLDPERPAEEFLGERYRDMLSEGAPAIRAVIELLAQPDDLPLAFYCAAGKDRTGVMSAVLLDALGVDHAAIAEDYHESAERVDRIRALQHGDAGSMVDQPAQFLQAPPGAMLLLLRWIAETHGGSRGYLGSIGVAPETLDALDAQLTETAGR